jgi:hypothetical protein
MNDTMSLVARRAASDDESIISLRRRNREYGDTNDTKQREVDSILGHLGLVVPLPSLRGFWSALGVDQGDLKKSASSDTKVLQVDSISGAGSEDVTEDKSFAAKSDEASERSNQSERSNRSERSYRSEIDSDMATLTKDVSKSQDELGSDWINRRTEKKKSQFKMKKLSQCFTFHRKKADVDFNPPRNKRRRWFKKRSKESKAGPQLLI